MGSADTDRTKFTTTLFRLGSYVYGLGIVALGALGLVWQDFVVGQPVPDTLPGRPVLACLAGAVMLIGGAAILVRRTKAFGAAAMAIYFTLIVVIAMNGPGLLSQWTVYGEYEGVAVQLAIASGALIAFAATAGIDAVLAVRLTRLGLVIFGMCAIVFGGAHFVYPSLTVPLVPIWLPPSQVFWADATGIAHIAAGVAILIGLRAHLAAILLTAMYAGFQVLVHVPMLIADPSSHFIWGENATNLALTGVAWIAVGALARPSPAP